METLIRKLTEQDMSLDAFRALIHLNEPLRSHILNICYCYPSYVIAELKCLGPSLTPYHDQILIEEPTVLFELVVTTVDFLYRSQVFTRQTKNLTSISNPWAKRTPPPSDMVQRRKRTKLVSVSMVAIYKDPLDEPTREAIMRQNLFDNYVPDGEGETCPVWLQKCNGRYTPCAKPSCSKDMYCEPHSTISSHRTLLACGKAIEHKGRLFLYRCYYIVNQTTGLCPCCDIN